LGVHESLAQRDRACRPGWSQLHKANLLVDRLVVVRIEAHLFGIERLCTVHIGDGNRNQFQFPVHECLLLRSTAEANNRSQKVAERSTGIHGMSHQSVTSSRGSTDSRQRPSRSTACSRTMDRTSSSRELSRHTVWRIQATRSSRPVKPPRCSDSQSSTYGSIPDPRTTWRASSQLGPVGRSRSQKCFQSARSKGRLRGCDRVISITTRRRAAYWSASMNGARSATL